MLRAKQVGTISQSARSLFLGGSRCTTLDGSSSTCNEDEACTSRRPLQSNGQNLQASPKIGSLILSDAAEGNSGQKVLPTSSSLDKVDSEEMLHSSPPISDHLMKAGIAAVGFLSDLVNYKIPTLDGSALYTSSQNSVIDQSRPISNIRSSNIKTLKKDKGYETSSVQTSSGSSSCGTKSRAHNADVSSYESRDFVDSCGPSFGPRDRKRSTPQSSRVFSNHVKPNVQHSEGKFVRRKTTPAKRFLNSSHVVESISGILQQSKWSIATEEAFRNLNCLPNAYQANQILKQLQDYNVALSFFYWLKRQPGFKHDGHTYTTMVGILGRARQFGTIHKLLDQMISDGCQPNVVTYNRLIHSYGRANYLSEAINVFNQMKSVGCEPDRVTYCTLIDIHAKAGYLDIAMDMYQRMQEAGLSPDTFTYSVIINCLGKAGHLAMAHKLFTEMVNHGCVPNLVTYNIMIALQAKARNYDSALQLYRDMQNAGFAPDNVTYSIVMEVLGHCGYLDEAEVVFAEMKRKNWVPDEPVYGLLVDMWGKAGKPEKAMQWYQTMLHEGLRPNVPTCNSLLSAFLRVHRLADAYNVLQSMLALGLNPSLQTYTLLLSCCTEAQTTLDMGFCCQLMTVTGHPAHTFLLSMPTPGPSGQNVRDHVSNFLDMMHSEDRESKRGLVDAIIDFFRKTGLKEEAGSVWEVAVEKNVYPDTVREKSPCYWLVNLHVMSNGTAVTALSRTLAWFRREMLVSGKCPSRIDIVTGWGRRSRVTGESLVRQSVQELLNVFRFPFFMENGNSGCFVGRGESLNQWLLQSYVERMHLL